MASLKQKLHRREVRRGVIGKELPTLEARVEEAHRLLERPGAEWFAPYSVDEYLLVRSIDIIDEIDRLRNDGCDWRGIDPGSDWLTRRVAERRGRVLA